MAKTKKGAKKGDGRYIFYMPLGVRIVIDNKSDPRNVEMLERAFARTTKEK